MIYSIKSLFKSKYIEYVYFLRSMLLQYLPYNCRTVLPSTFHEMGAFYFKKIEETSLTQHKWPETTTHKQSLIMGV